MAAAPGNQYAAKAKRWTAAIDKALEAKSRRDGIEALEQLAEKLIELAMAGDLSALKELGDRMEGKPSQQILGAGEQGEHLFGEIVRKVIDPSERTPD